MKLLVLGGTVFLGRAIVEDARLALAVLAVAFYRDPSREMRVIGITGTSTPETSDTTA